MESSLSRHTFNVTNLCDAFGKHAESFPSVSKVIKRDVIFYTRKSSKFLEAWLRNLAFSLTYGINGKPQFILTDYSEEGHVVKFMRFTEFFLSADHWNTLDEKEIESLEKSLVGVLESFSLCLALMASAAQSQTSSCKSHKNISSFFFFIPGVLMKYFCNLFSALDSAEVSAPGKNLPFFSHRISTVFKERKEILNAILPIPGLKYERYELPLFHGLKRRDLLSIKNKVNWIRIEILFTPSYKEMYFHLAVPRNEVMVQAAMEKISQADIQLLKTGFIVEYQDTGVWGTGVTRDFINFIFTQCFHPKNKLFASCPKDGRCFFPYPVRFPFLFLISHCSFFAVLPIFLRLQSQELRTF